MENTEEELKQSQGDGWDSLVLTRDEAKCRDKDLEKWKAELKEVLSRIISSKLIQIRKTNKLKETDKHIIDAFLLFLVAELRKNKSRYLKTSEQVKST